MLIVIVTVVNTMFTPSFFGEDKANKELKPARVFSGYTVPSQIIVTDDGAQLISAGLSRSIALRDISSGTTVREINCSCATRSMSMSHDGKYLAASSICYGGPVDVFDLPSGRRVFRFLCADRKLFSSVAFANNGSFVAVATDNIILKWTFRSNESHWWPAAHTKQINAIQLSPKGQTLASASSDHDIRIWNAASGMCETVLVGHTDEVFCLAYDSSGDVLMSGGADDSVVAWDTTKKQLIGRYVGHSADVYAVAMSRDGRALVSGSADKSVRVWDVNSRKCVGVLVGNKGRVFSVALSPDGRSVVSSGDEGEIYVWDIGQGHSSVSE